MKIHVAKTAEELGAHAALTIAEKLCEAIAESGEARLVLSTGGSQFETLKALLQEDVPWEKVTAFHLDEYIDLLLYYLKYRECNPQVLELMIESFKMGTLVEA